MQQKFFVGNLENSKPFLAIVLKFQDYTNVIAQKKCCFKLKVYNLLFQNLVVHRLMYFQYEIINILMWK